jgi:putative oxidoreductase
MNVILWILQVLLALLFLFAGGSKLVMSAEALSQPATPNQVMLPVAFLRFIGVCELLGGLGLLLPGLFKIKQYLTPLAALGLAIIMIGAVIFSAVSGLIPVALVNLIIVLLLLFIAYARWRVRPHGG